MEASSSGSIALIRVRRLDDVGAGLALDLQDDGRLAVVPGRQFLVLQPFDGVADILEHHRRAVAIGDDSVAIGVGDEQLVVVADLKAIAAARRSRPWADRPYWPAIALRTSSSDSPRAASCLGLTCRRTARAWPPAMVTWPTPSTCDSFGDERGRGEFGDRHRAAWCRRSAPAPAPACRRD